MVLNLTNFRLKTHLFITYYLFIFYFYKNYTIYTKSTISVFEESKQATLSMSTDYVNLWISGE